MFLTWAEGINCNITSIKAFVKKKPLPSLLSVLLVIYMCECAIPQIGLVQFFLYFKGGLVIRKGMRRQFLSPLYRFTKDIPKVAHTALPGQPNQSFGGGGVKLLSVNCTQSLSGTEVCR